MYVFLDFKSRILLLKFLLPNFFFYQIVCQFHWLVLVVSLSLYVFFLSLIWLNQIKMKKNVLLFSILKFSLSNYYFFSLSFSLSNLLISSYCFSLISLLLFFPWFDRHSFVGWFDHDDVIGFRLKVFYCFKVQKLNLKFKLNQLLFFRLLRFQVKNKKLLFLHVFFSLTKNACNIFTV